MGCPLTAADRALLRLRPLRHYAAGELVAVKRHPPAAAAGLPSGQAAAAAAEARAAAAQAGAAAQQQQQDGAADSLVYGRVAVDAAPAKGQAAYRLSVEVAPGVYETLLSTQVFCFQSGAQGAPPAASASHHEPSASAAAASSSAAEQDAAAAAAAAPSQQASELAAAVADMLNAAGMPLDLDKQQLLQRALAADAQLAQVCSAGWLGDRSCRMCGDDAGS